MLSRSPTYHWHVVIVTLQAAITAPEVCMRIYRQNCLFQDQSSFALRKLFLYALVLEERIHILLVIAKGYRVQATTI